MWPWPDPRSRWRRSRGFWSSKNCRKLHFFRSISAISAWSLTVIVDHDSMGPGLQLGRAWFSNFLNKGIMWVQTSQNVDITLISNGHISVLLGATVTWSVYVLYMLMWPWPDPKVTVTDFLNFFANCILAWSSKLMVDYDSMSLVYSYSKPNFWISPPVGGHMTSKFVKCWYHRNPLGFVSALAAARSLWLWLQVCRNTPYTLMTISPLVGLFYGRPLALCNRAEHYIFALWFLSSIYLSSFFPRLISAATDWMSTILLHMAWP